MIWPIVYQNDSISKWPIVITTMIDNDRNSSTHNDHDKNSRENDYIYICNVCSQCASSVIEYYVCMYVYIYIVP